MVVCLPGKQEMQGSIPYERDYEKVNSITGLSKNVENEHEGEGEDVRVRVRDKNLSYEIN